MSLPAAGGDKDLKASVRIFWSSLLSTGLESVPRARGDYVGELDIYGAVTREYSERLSGEQSVRLTGWTCPNTQLLVQWVEDVIVGQREIQTVKGFGKQIENQAEEQSTVGIAECGRALPFETSCGSRATEGVLAWSQVQLVWRRPASCVKSGLGNCGNATFQKGLAKIVEQYKCATIMTLASHCWGLRLDPRPWYWRAGIIPDSDLMWRVWRLSLCTPVIYSVSIPPLIQFISPHPCSWLGTPWGSRPQLTRRSCLRREYQGVSIFLWYFHNVVKDCSSGILVLERETQGENHLRHIVARYRTRVLPNAGETGDLRVNPLTSDIVQHDYHVGKSGEQPRWELNPSCLGVKRTLTTSSPWPQLLRTVARYPSPTDDSVSQDNVLRLEERLPSETRDATSWIVRRSSAGTRIHTTHPQATPTTHLLLPLFHLHPALARQAGQLCSKQAVHCRNTENGHCAAGMSSRPLILCTVEVSPVYEQTVTNADVRFSLKAIIVCGWSCGNTPCLFSEDRGFDYK
ncbi:hypothetical protein PR048_020271 [Dryococelus australis]|uniref:Uncharacterized protein n=1 Tax=Dryococelus australis TaxID=614101 RepID=A0ABQ9H5U2_9NEOP|nr:hypothetical protein PR048_020271 [Dryococelus australis]